MPEILQVQFIGARREIETALSQQTAPHADILPDVEYFLEQQRVFEREKISQVAAKLDVADKGSDSKAPSGEIIVRAPDLVMGVHENYSKLLTALEASDLKLRRVESDEAAWIFRNGLLDFLGKREGQSFLSSAFFAHSTIPPLTVNTIVNSNRAGDTIIYSKGFFLSTGTAFGVSTPARRALLPGRYCFGIVDGGAPKYENLLWPVAPQGPVHVRLNKP